ncbi:aromatic ring-opening dioxygenase LigA [Isoptericola sp. S6320L]|uniref:aromatic ring-opening dioxygenase LigA n=1 Tax=Isoptericola sp. S6320L TaxID=2926411 RepID=UPI0027E379EE|nr:aromatic ring-opening dioxygenase LigA [Isoptericola sp. S6320L]
MSSTVTVRPAKGVRGIGMFSIIAGIVLVLAGVAVWIVVSMTLSDEQIVVSDDANMFAGQQVAGPFTAYAQAEVIDMHALEMADGQTYAELDQDDPVRATVMNASFLRASLFTSVVAFGVCALVIGLGLLFILIGAALRKLAGGPAVAVETPGSTSQGDLSAPPRHAESSAGTAAPPERHTTRPDAAPPSGRTDPPRT